MGTVRARLQKKFCIPDSDFENCRLAWIMVAVPTTNWYSRAWNSDKNNANGGSNAKGSSGRLDVKKVEWMEDDSELIKVPTEKGVVLGLSVHRIAMLSTGRSAVRGRKKSRGYRSWGNSNSGIVIHDV